MAIDAKTELETVVTTKLGRAVTWIHADLFRSNFIVDQLEPNADWPVFIYLTPVRKRNTSDDNTRAIKRKISVNGYFLDKPSFPSGDYTSLDVEPIIKNMENLADKLIFKLNDQNTTQVTDIQAGGVKEWSYDGVYFKFDAGVFGVLVTFDWPVNEGVTGC